MSELLRTRTKTGAKKKKTKNKARTSKMRKIIRTEIIVGMTLFSHFLLNANFVMQGFFIHNKKKRRFFHRFATGNNYIIDER